MMKRLFKAGVPIFLFLLLTLSCEKRELWMEPADEPTLSLLKTDFEKKQTTFSARSDLPEYSWRQQLHRTIHWEKLYQNAKGQYLIPVTLSLHQNENSRFSDGSKVYPYRTVLIITFENGQWQYTFLTFLPGRQTSTNFTGTMLFEDYFLGNVKRADYKDGIRISHDGGNVQPSGLRMSQASGGPMDCNWVFVGSVCVVDLDYGSEPDICTDTYEYICTAIPPGDPDDFPGGGDSGGDPGGGGGNNGDNNGNPTDGIDTSELSSEQQALLQQAIDEILLKCGFKAVYNKILNEGEVTIRIGSTTLAAYTPAIKEILFSENIPDILLNRGDILVHELFHAYQHQMVYGSSFLSYGFTYDINNNKIYHPGYINVEFEQIVFQDIVKRISDGRNGVGDMFTEPGSNTARDQYRLWIDTLTSHGTAYPDLNSITGFDAAYMTHLNNFKIYGHTGYTGSAIIPGLLPDALKQLYNNSLNCND